MVLVPFHMLASILLSVVKMLRILSQDNRGEAKRCPLHLSVAAQDVLSCLTFASGLKSMTESAERAIHLLLPQVVDTIIFALSPDSDELEALGRAGINTPKLPLDGIVREAVDGSKRVILSSVSTEDPILALLPIAGQLETKQRVILSPLHKDSKLVAFIVVVCVISEDSLPHLDYTEQQILQSYHHIRERRKYVQDFERQTAFLEFFSRSYEKDVGPLSQKIGEFLQRQTCAESSAIFVLDHTAGELHNKQESNNNTSEKRIEVSGSIFEEVVQCKRKLNVSNITKVHKVLICRCLNFER